MFKPSLVMAGVLLMVLSAGAQVEMRDAHPQTYVVQRGDTLWDIAARFLRRPWEWPEIWHINQQIENPHLIFPGDVIRLTYVDGMPRLTVDRAARPTVRLSPGVRRSSLAEAITPIDFNDLRPFLDKRLVLSAEELEGLPYVVAIEDGHLAGTSPYNVYVRDLDASPGQRFAVVRPTVEFLEVPEKYPFRTKDRVPERRPWRYPPQPSLSDYVSDLWENTITRHYYNQTEVLGYEVVQAAVGEVVASGDPSTLRLEDSEIEVVPGDLLMPVFDLDYDLEYYPHAAAVPENTRVLSLTGALYGAGRHQVIAINKGTNDGIEHGQVMSIYRPSFKIRDEVRYPHSAFTTFFALDRGKTTIQIPEEYAGHVMIFKAYEDISYGLVVRAEREVKLADVLHAP